MDLGVPVIKLRNSRVFGKNQVSDSINVLGRAFGADFVPQCIMKACRADRFKFSLSFLHILSALFDIQFKRNRETQEFII